MILRHQIINSMAQKASEFVMSGSTIQMNLFPGLYKMAIRIASQLTASTHPRTIAQRIAVGFLNNSILSINQLRIIT